MIPAKKRNCCIFKESCSNYVYKVCKQKGLLAGLKALKYRVKNCQPGYQLIETNGEVLLITVANEVIREKEHHINL